MKRFLFNSFFVLSFLLCSFFLFAQSDTTLAEQAVVETTKSIGSIVGDIIKLIIFVGAALFIIGHMIYILYKGARFKEDFSVEGFRLKRKEAGKNEESSDEENQKCWDLIAQVFQSYGHVEKGDEGIEYRKPRKMKEIKKSSDILEQVIEIAPTDQELVDKINEHKEVINSNEKRRFDGSWKLIVLGLAIAIIVSLITKKEIGFFLAFLKYGAFFWVPVVIYYISSLTPQFLIEKRYKRGGGNVSTGLVAFAFAVLGSGQTVRTRYTDGTYEDDHSGHFMALMLGVIALLIVALTIVVWAVLNYLRNYVLYF